MLFLLTSWALLGLFLFCLRIFANASVQSEPVRFDVISHMPKISSAFQHLVSREQLLTHQNLFIYGQVSSMYHLGSSAPPSFPLRLLPACIYIFPRFKNVCEYSQTWPKTEETALLRRILKSAQKAKKWTSAIVLHHFFVLCFNCSLETLFSYPKTFANLAVFCFFLLGAALAV